VPPVSTFMSKYVLKQVSLTHTVSAQFSASIRIIEAKEMHYFSTLF